MLFWIIALRVAGSAYFIWTIAAQPWSSLGMGTSIENAIVSSIFQSAVVAVVCYGLAAGLTRLEQLDERTEKHSLALRRLLPPGKKSPQDHDLAPHAPQNWQEFKPRPLDPEREKDASFEQRLARRWRYVERPKQRRQVQ
jgi:hypothetical protein